MRRNKYLDAVVRSFAGFDTGDSVLAFGRAVLSSGQPFAGCRDATASRIGGTVRIAE